MRRSIRSSAQPYSWREGGRAAAEQWHEQWRGGRDAAAARRAEAERASVLHVCSGYGAPRHERTSNVGTPT